MRRKHTKKVLPIVLLIALVGVVYFSGSKSPLASKPHRSTAPIPTITLLTPTPTITQLITSSPK